MRKQESVRTDRTEQKAQSTSTSPLLGDGHKLQAYELADTAVGRRQAKLTLRVASSWGSEDGG